MRCIRCGKEMNNILHFESSRDFQYNYCKYCKEHTKKKRIHYDELERGKNHEDRCY